LDRLFRLELLRLFLRSRSYDEEESDEEEEEEEDEEEDDDDDETDSLSEDAED